MKPINLSRLEALQIDTVLAGATLDAMRPLHTNSDQFDLGALQFLREIQHHPSPSLLLKETTNEKTKSS